MAGHRPLVAPREAAISEDHTQRSSPPHGASPPATDRGRGARARHTSPRRTQLTRTEIVDAALRITRDSGVAALPMRRLADELGVAPSALYRHITGRDALIELLSDEVLDTNVLPGPDVGNWEARLHQFSRNTNAVLSQYPGLVPMLLDHPSPAALRIVNFAVGLLREAGYSGEDAYRAFTALTFQSAGRYIISANSNRHTPERRSILPPNASREEYPALADIADPAVDIDDAYNYASAIFLAGLQAMAERPRED